MEMFSGPLTSVDKRGLLAGGFVIAAALVLPFHLFHRTSGWSYRDLVAQIHGNSTDAQVLESGAVLDHTLARGETWLPLLVLRPLTYRS